MRAAERLALISLTPSPSPASGRGEMEWCKGV